MRLFSIFFPPGQVTHLAFFFLGQVIHDNSTISKIFEFHQKNLYVFPLCALSSPHFKYFQNNSSYLDMVSLLYLILFFSLQSLLSKISYETFYRKHCKEEGNCHNPFLGYYPNSFYLSKKKNIRTQNKKSKKTITMRRGCWSAQKIARNWLRRLKKTKIEI